MGATCLFACQGTSFDPWMQYVSNRGGFKGQTNNPPISKHLNLEEASG
jgi:hypothetical protein